MSTNSDPKYLMPAECKIGDMLKFKVISMKDTNIYSGNVIGITDFERARTYGDVAASHLEMEQGASQLNLDQLIDVTKQKFLIISLVNGEIKPFAFEWLMTVNSDYGTSGKVERIEVGATYTIRLYNVSSADASTALNILKSNGYVCKLMKSTTS